MNPKIFLNLITKNPCQNFGMERLFWGISERWEGFKKFWKKFLLKNFIFQNFFD